VLGDGGGVFGNGPGVFGDGPGVFGDGPGVFGDGRGVCRSGWTAVVVTRERPDDPSALCTIQNTEEPEL
jgi:hypothetical protein